MASGDGRAVEATLAAEARHLSDGGGEFFAARVPVVGRERVAKLFLGLLKQDPVEHMRWAVRMINGLPAIVVERPARPGLVPRFMLQCEIGPDGLVRELYSVLATPKLTAVRPLG